MPANACWFIRRIFSSCLLGLRSVPLERQGLAQVLGLTGQSKVALTAQRLAAGILIPKSPVLHSRLHPLKVRGFSSGRPMKHGPVMALQNGGMNTVFSTSIT